MEIAQRYQAGETLSQLATSYSCCTQAVSNALERRHIPRRGPRTTRSTPLTSEQEKEIVRRFLDGGRVHTLTREFGIGRKRLYKIVESAGHVPMRGPLTGPRHPWWKGGRTAANGVGYISIWIPPNHSMASMRNHKGRVMEHRLIMAEALERPLAPWETVHHVNGRKNDNRIENLQLHNHEHGPGQLYRCLACGSFNVEAVPLQREETP